MTPYWLIFLAPHIDWGGEMMATQVGKPGELMFDRRVADPPRKERRKSNLDQGLVVVLIILAAWALYFSFVG